MLLTEEQNETRLFCGCHLDIAKGASSISSENQVQNILNFYSSGILST